MHTTIQIEHWYAQKFSTLNVSFLVKKKLIQQFLKSVQYVEKSKRMQRLHALYGWTEFVSEVLGISIRINLNEINSTLVMFIDEVTLVFIVTKWGFIACCVRGCVSSDI